MLIRMLIAIHTTVSQKKNKKKNPPKDKNGGEVLTVLWSIQIKSLLTESNSVPKKKKNVSPLSQWNIQRLWM